MLPIRISFLNAENIEARKHDCCSCLAGKMRNKILINCKVNYNRYNLITKKGRIFESPLCLRLGSSCGDGE